ncbi:MAG: hypothetical protein HY298_17055 [Verrucomicrobia bacterium]|nr:hypothetical protein [Verrucomicrobiota bacterium]
MTQLWIVFWTAIIFGSIAWYGFLLFYIGIKAWKEIGQLARTLESRKPPAKAKE